MKSVANFICLKRQLEQNKSKQLRFSVYCLFSQILWPTIIQHKKSPLLRMLELLVFVISCRVYEEESERRIKSFRVAGRMKNGYHNYQSPLSSQLNNDTLKQRSIETVRHTDDSIVSNNKTVTVGDKKDIINDGNDESRERTGFTSRNQFDRSSQLRRSKKKRRKSDVGNNSSVMSPSVKKDETCDTSSSNKENMTLDASSVSRSCSVRDEQCSKVLSDTLDNSSVSRMHERTFTSRAEYSSNYGNLI